MCALLVLSVAEICSQGICFPGIGKSQVVPAVASGCGESGFTNRISVRRTSFTDCVRRMETADLGTFSEVLELALRNGLALREKLVLTR